MKGKEHIILREDEWGGFESIGVEKLTAKVKDVFTEENLRAVEADMPSGFREMRLVAAIKYDAAHKNVMGWRQHQKVLKVEGFNV